ncbi:MAG: hypothetical protein WGN25_07345 [Candidatus Electrothrix sp. GW3-4]|uniref:hypothetical protein n=1 Tax=Candidatus Electrothrix sp. GW3-4 TaxID=3126740 RepID=UPI0030CE6913
MDNHIKQLDVIVQSFNKFIQTLGKKVQRLDHVIQSLDKKAHLLDKLIEAFDKERVNFYSFFRWIHYICSLLARKVTGWHGPIYHADKGQDSLSRLSRKT